MPCVRQVAPLVGTGVEKLAAENSGYVVLAEDDGEITAVDADKIELTTKKEKF